MIEVFPKEIDEKRARVQLQKLVAAFLCLAEEEAAKEGRDHLNTTSRGAADAAAPLSVAPANPLAASSKSPEQGVSA